MICYKETQNTKKMDRHDVWTGTFRDSRAINPRGSRPENALSGHMFVANAQRVDALFVDGERFGRHRAWRNTSVAQGQQLLHAERRPGPRVGRGRRQRLVAPSPPAALVYYGGQRAVPEDVGAVFDSCSATHNLVLSRHEESGAWTFGSGTVQWSWALDDVHDANDPQRQNKYSIRVEKDTAGVVRDLQQLTVNVFQMQGVLPATLDASLVLVEESDDLEAPTASLLYANLEDGVLRLSGSASDVGGVVASVEVSWSHGRWHLAELDRLASEVKWSLAWGHEEWHALHGELPGGDYPFELRVADDSGTRKRGAGPAGNGGGGHRCWCAFLRDVQANLRAKII